MYLHANSNHAPHTKAGLPYSQALLIRWNTTEDIDLDGQIYILTNAFLNRGYMKKHILQQISRVKPFTQRDLIIVKPKRSMTRIPLILTYYPQLKEVGQLVRQLWEWMNEWTDTSLRYSTATEERYVLSTDDAPIFSDYPIVGFENTATIGSRIMSSMYPPRWRIPDVWNI